MPPEHLAHADKISVRMIRGTDPSTAPVLAQIFNTSIKTGKIPSVWKASYTVPIPKGTNSSTDPSGYRPISLLSVVSKLLEKIIHNRVLASLQETCPLPTNQWGFLPERSTSGALLAATHDWFTELDKGNEVPAVFFDIKKPLTRCLRGCSYINFKGMDLMHTFSGGSVAISLTEHRQSF